MNPGENITAWFTDAATRHPDIRHTTATPRFFEMEWDEIIQNGGMQALTNWTLVLEDYEDAIDDNGGDYISRIHHLAYMVVRTIPMGDAAGKKTAYTDAQRIAEQILAKMYADSLAGPCDKDLPAPVQPPVKVLLSTAKGTRVGPVPAFDHAFGYRIAVDIRTDGNFPLDTTAAGWIPLP